MTPLIVRDGIVKSRVVAQMWIAEGLISDRDDTQQLCVHMIVQQLAHVSCGQLLDEALPGILLWGIEDRYDGFLYQCIDRAWSGYFGARASAIFDPASGDAHRQLVIATLKRAQSEVPNARLEYRSHGELDKFLKVALPAISNFLNHLGQLLGHKHGLSQDTFDDPELGDALELAGLNSWLDLFGSDLALLWDRRGEWRSMDEFLILNRNVERIFWHFGLFPCKTDDGIYLHIPIGTDTIRLVD